MILYYRDYNGEEKPTLLKPKYEELHELYNKMTQALPKRRPDCKEILESKLWALDKNEFEFKNEMKAILKTQKNQNLFIYSILESKLSEILDKNH